MTGVFQVSTLLQSSLKPLGSLPAKLLSITILSEGSGICNVLLHLPLPDLRDPSWVFPTRVKDLDRLLGSQLWHG